MKTTIINKTSTEVATYNSANAEAISLGLLSAWEQSPEAIQREAHLLKLNEQEAKAKEAAALRTSKLATIVSKYLLPGDSITPGDFSLDPMHSQGSAWRTGPLAGYTLRYSHGARPLANYRLDAGGKLNWAKIEERIEATILSLRQVQAAKAKDATTKALGAALFAPLQARADKAIVQGIKAREGSKEGTLTLYRECWDTNLRREVSTTYYANLTLSQIDRLLTAKEVCQAAVASILEEGK